jgi:Domain of unknown function (DUF4124)
MKPRYLLVLLCACYSGWAQAEIYKYKDHQGHVTYSSEPIKGARKLHLEPLPTMTPFNASAFPNVDQTTQRNRDDSRRKILQDELALEEKLLATARQNLKDTEANPGILLGPETYRNAALVDEKLKPLQAEVSHHERNVSALKTELSHLK